MIEIKVEDADVIVRWRGDAAWLLHCRTPDEAGEEIKHLNVEFQGAASRTNDTGVERLIVTYRKSWYSIRDRYDYTVLDRRLARAHHGGSSLS